MRIQAFIDCSLRSCFARQAFSLLADAKRGTAAVTVWTAPHARAVPQLDPWIIWNRPEFGEDGTETATLVYTHSGATSPDLFADSSILDTEGKHARSAFTPVFTVFGGHMHLVVVKPDRRDTLAHYAYVEDGNAWEYNVD